MNLRNGDIGGALVADNLGSRGDVQGRGRKTTISVPTLK